MADKVLSDVRTKLKDGVTMVILKQLLDDLRKGGVLNEEETESVLEDNTSRADRVRCLTDMVRKKGPKASEEMIALLKQWDRKLYETLGLGSGQVQNISKIPESNKDDEYTMTSDPRGLCVIINNAHFDKSGMKELIGYNKDAADLKEVFGWLGFRTRLYHNQSAEQIRDLMKELGQYQIHGDCFVCCVLSHGGKEKVVGRDVVDGPHNVKDVKEKQVVYGRDGKPCFIKEDILSPFNGVKCPSLVKKPKVFFIQACRGPGNQRLVVASAASLDTRPVEGYTLPEDADFLLSFATVEDYVSLVDSETGSWFIQSLCKQLKEGCPRGYDILQILTNVNNEVSKIEGFGYKQMPEPSFTLTKKLVFRKP